MFKGFNGEQVLQGALSAQWANGYDGRTDRQTQKSVDVLLHVVYVGNHFSNQKTDPSRLKLWNSK